MRFNFFFVNVAALEKVLIMIFRLNSRFRGFPDSWGKAGSDPLFASSARCICAFLALLLVSFSLAGCKEPTRLNSSANPPVDYQLPMNLSVEDKAGRTLEIQLLARSDYSMTFVRLSDNLEFTFPLNRLSPKDQALVRKFPQTSNMPSDSSVAGQYIATRKKAIARLTEDVIALRVSLATDGLTASSTKAKSNELQRKTAEIAKMKDQIKEKEKSR